MSSITLELPKSLHTKINELSKTEGISTTQFLILAAAEKMSAILTENYLEEEAKKGRRDDFDRVMKAVPCVEPEEDDCIL
ncbi:MAG: toxin-antitoxin system HicB family antitoxin [Desulfamplus sp.]|nr:toxin-antitoxin system HicB family antitoxin [Desulfamplus sp.]